ncbi:VOC family protein [Granulicella arctica]|uniref:VOC family protein n=1 Tax=Granulicella arctica TaxID=940613 RepID=UPI0021E09389|nr:VOC family protein [Granulicella arctica]
MTTSSKHADKPQVIGPSFIALQVRDLEASRKFYLEQVGLTASPHMPPGAVIFEAKPIPFAIRTPMVDLDATSKLGWGVSFWMAATDADALHAELVEKGVSIVLPPADGPFGRFFSFRDPDGYGITVHTAKQAAA